MPVLTGAVTSQVLAHLERGGSPGRSGRPELGFQSPNSGLRLVERGLKRQHAGRVGVRGRGQGRGGLSCVRGVFCVFGRFCLCGHRLGLDLDRAWGRGGSGKDYG